MTTNFHKSRYKIDDDRNDSDDNMNSKYLSKSWIPSIVVALLIGIVAVAFGSTYIIERNLAPIPTAVPIPTVVIRGVYESVKAASTVPIFRVAASSAGTLSEEPENEKVGGEEEVVRLDLYDTTTVSIDGVTVGVGDRVLLKNEANSQKNGIYVNNGTTLVRSEDMDSASQVTPGNSIYVNEGVVNGGSSFMLFQITSGTSLDPITGYGITFTNTTSIALGLSADTPNGYFLTSDNTKPTKTEWTDPSMIGSSVRGNPTSSTAFPQDITINPATLLTADISGLKILDPPVASGYVLSYDGTDLTWIAAGGVGTVTSVGTDSGSGLLAAPNPIVAGGTIRMADMPAYTIKANNTSGSTAPTDMALTRASIVTRNASSLVALQPSVSGSVLTYNGTDLAWAQLPLSFTALQRSSNAKPSETPVLDTWVKRPLATLVNPAGTGDVTLSGGNMVLTAGRWWIRATAVSFRCGPNYLRLYNVTTSTEEFQGVPSHSGTTIDDNASVPVSLDASIILTTTTTYELDHLVSNVIPSSTFGLNSGGPSTLAGGHYPFNNFVTVSLLKLG